MTRAAPEPAVELGPRLRELVLAFDPELPLARASTPPSAWYREPALLELERAALLRRSWQAVCRADEVAAPGSYTTGTLLGEPYLIARDASGELRAFYNVCRHRAARLLEGRGECSEIACPYHGWTYSCAGRLTRAPGMGALEDLERGSLDLVPIALAELGPLLLLQLDAGGPPLAELTRELPPQLAPAALRGLRFAAQRSYRLRCNWKVAIENYLDGGYHVPVLHRGLAANLQMASYRTAVSGALVTQSAAAEPGDERLGGGAVYSWLPPALMLNRYGPVLDVNRVVPLGPELTAIHYDFFFEPDAAADPQFVAQALAQSHAIQLEDSAICRRVQQGLRSHSFERGRYAPRYEQGVHHFHCQLARALRAALGAP